MREGWTSPCDPTQFILRPEQMVSYVEGAGQPNTLNTICMEVTVGHTKTKSGKTNFRNTQEMRSAEDEFFAVAEDEQPGLEEN